MQFLNPIDAMPVAVEEIRFRDDRFAGGGFREYSNGSGFRQRCLIEDGAIFCETVTEANCTLEHALRQVCGPWNWWDHGRASDFQPAGRYNDQMLAPVSWFLTRVNIRQFAPVPCTSPDFPGMRGYRVPAWLSRHFLGAATVEVFEKETGGVIVRGRFHGVRSHVPGTPVFLAAKMHLRAEAGNLYWPFPQGTGFKGLLRRLEGGDVRQPLARPGFAANLEILAR